jgi:alkanesulfonate monooxygenase SsuD/methylene tetrahydromethanopterin reductase-like flavin-dependent oxidoreductase (luciferase family)
VKIGVVLPTFRVDAREALRVADAAQGAGLDGVFAFDHLWPMGSPQRPSLAPFPLLAAVAAEFGHLVIGPLVARVGLVATTKLVEQFSTLTAIAPGRVIAGLGTGDRLSEPEMRAYDLEVGTSATRRQLLDDAIVALGSMVEIWCGAGARSTNDLARRRGVAINFWGVSAEHVREQAREGPVNWAGPLGEHPFATLSALDEAGATWAISSWPVDIGKLKEWREES